MKKQNQLFFQKNGSNIYKLDKFKNYYYKLNKKTNNSNKNFLINLIQFFIKQARADQLKISQAVQH